MYSKYLKWIFGAATLVLVPGFAHANAGVPMLYLAAPVFLLSLIPIILIETYYLSKRLSLAAMLAAKIVTISNLVSTIVGVPLTWGLLLLVQIITGGGSAYGIDTAVEKVIAVTWQAAWLIPYESDLNWMIPIAGTVLLIPFYFVSWWSEYFISAKFLKNVPAESVKIAVRNANRITYSALAIWPLGMLVAGAISAV